MRKAIPQMEPWFGREERRALSLYMDEGGWITEHKRTAEFERLIADYTGAKHCIVVNNGTVALTVAAMVCGIGPGDEVIVPNFTMIATPNSVKILGATPVFVDVEPASLCMDVARAQKAITKRTKAIMLVSANGRYPLSGIDAFVKLSKRAGIKLIEDAAQSLGSRYPDGRHMGTVGHIGTFSFSAPKVISTGQGGAIITNDTALAASVRRLKDFGRAGGGTDIHDSIGYNFKFTELQACIGIEQMKKLPWRVKRKKEIYARYRTKLIGIPHIRLFDQDITATTPWFIDVLAEKRDALRKFLMDQGIGTRVMYPPINRQIAYKIPGTHAVSQLVGKKGLWLPSSARLSSADIDRVCATIKAFYAPQT